MRILIDSNILFSAILFPGSSVALAVSHVSTNHEIILCDQNIQEIREVVRRKKPSLSEALEDFLSELSYELIPTIGKTSTVIRDATDQPILNAAVLYDVDIILTGDKDFLSLDIERPVCMNARTYIDSFIAMKN